jgi:hypothetical protein
LGGRGEGELGEGGKGKGARESVVLFVHRSIASTCHSSFREFGNPGIRESGKEKKLALLKETSNPAIVLKFVSPKRGNSNRKKLDV